jgi:hypothetical protein
MAKHRGTASRQRFGGRFRGGRLVAVSIAGCVALSMGGVALAGDTVSSYPQVYVPIQPVQMFSSSMAADTQTDVDVYSVANGIPPGVDVFSVILSVTASMGTADGHVFLYATGSNEPATPNLRWQRNEPVTTEVTVAVGGGGVHLIEGPGSALIRLSLIGYYYSPQGPNIAYSAEVEGGALSPVTRVYATAAVPLGGYEVTASVNVHQLKATSSDIVSCDTVDPAGVMIGAGPAVELFAPSDTQSMSWSALDTTNDAGPVTIQCHDQTSRAVVGTGTSLVITPLVAASGDIWGA